jgi:hypothetical protein
MCDVARPAESGKRARDRLSDDFVIINYQYRSLLHFFPSRHPQRYDLFAAGTKASFAGLSLSVNVLAISGPSEIELALPSSGTASAISSEKSVSIEHAANCHTLCAEHAGSRALS